MNDAITDFNGTAGVFGDLKPVLPKGVSWSGAAENLQVTDLGEVVVGKGGGYHYGKVRVGVGETIESVTFAEADDVRSILISVHPDGGTATAVGKGLVGVVFDAPSSAIAAEWFADATADSQLATDVQVFVIPAGEEREFEFSSYLTSVWVRRVYGSETFRVGINASAMGAG